MGLLSGLPDRTLAILPLLAPLFALFRTEWHAGASNYGGKLGYSAVVSVAAFWATKKLVNVIKPYNLRAGLKGMDINKRGTKEGEKPVPEALGIVPGVVHIVCVIAAQLWFVEDTSRLVEFNAALLSICFMVLLGFVDDAIELPWRYKMVLPTVASLPLLVAYSGTTNVVVPIQLRGLFQAQFVELHIVYYVYMGLLAIFCSNSINILAGINGLEAGQSFVIGCAILAHNCLELGGEFHANHLFSLFIMMPFVAVTLGLLSHNWFPSKVFVGDTFAYFSGMTLAVAGILGHFSKTLLLFFIPQILNFLLSLPQILSLFGVNDSFPGKKCPRHRLPKFDQTTRLLSGEKMKLNVVNQWLRVFGPMTERQLCIQLMAFQAVCCGLAFFVRYNVSQWFF